MDKADLRTLVRADGDVSGTANAAVAEGLFEWLSPRLPGTITAFLAMAGEVDVSPLFERLPGWRWVLPRVEEDRTMTFRDRDVPLETHRFGMRQPSKAGPIVPVHEIDVFLAPGLAFDRAGGRVGNGAGFYDRVLASRRTDCEVVGVTIERRVFDEVPMDAHDQRVGWLATESGVTECSPNR